ncbi:hypothetical protein LOKG_00064 [Loktanella phage pCB2051-A]|uniref:Uncharacterized protein n=1 Tax=Loktanella phage pCB2051-A TaxID=754044 RepID=M4QPF8_9CAUD|nr:hypothetical protein LOKG_00064 [Loktanella phage pCB2051-A]AGH31500.1 hypothetical protein LOKG_00064 [Loktanella phage pCB2051-A]
MKVGDTRYRADVWEGKIDIDEWVLRSNQMRKTYGFLTHGGPFNVFSWVRKIPGVTWSKQSKKHGDFGFHKSIPEIYRRTHLGPGSCPFRPTKLGALMELRASTNKRLKTHGDEAFEGDEDYPPEIGHKAELKIIDAAIKRERNKKASNAQG